MAEMNSDDQSLKRQVDALTLQASNLKAKKLQMQSASSDQVKAQIQTINDKKARMIDADKKQRVSAINTARAESTYPLDDNIIVEATTSDNNTFKHNGKDHALKIKDMKSSHGEFELHHDGSKWDLSNDSKKAYPHTSKAITATGFLNKVNKQWKTPSGNMSKDIQLGNVYHSHKNAEPINTHYGQDLKTNYIQVTGAGFYHTGNDEAKLGSPELAGKTDFRASMNRRKAKNGKYSASIVMALKDPKKSIHCLDAPLKEYTTMLQVIESEEIWISESSLNPKDPHKDYQEKSKVLQGLMLNKDVDQKHVGQRRLDLDKEYAKIKEETELDEAHKIHDKVEIIKGSAKGTRGHIGEIRHGAFKGAPKSYTVYHGEHDAAQVSKEHIRAIKEAVDVMANLRQAHDRHMAKALAANKGGDDIAVKVHQVYMQKLQAKMQKLKRNEETIIESHLIHVSDGSKYGDEPSKKDVDHVMAGVKAHNGEHDGSSDKGAFFKFKSHSDAENFKRHVDKCPGKTCYADHSESTEFTAPSLDEISNATLTSYKQKAGEQASAADKVGDFKKGNKRFSGIIKATKKQFANDLKKEDLDESRGHKVIATFFKNRESWNKAASERDAKHNEIEKKRQAEKAAGKENMSSAIDRLAKHVNEEGEGGVAANNAGDGKIAGFAGDAGKKAVMSKKILQRKTLGDFKKFVSQEHDEN
ncbi:hypothetical protein [Lake Baikal phage Baikal-20-5m-C28]|nr:hypothetical protein [Lake Baikal phage Baikal-20-5m-C28]